MRRPARLTALAPLLALALVAGCSPTSTAGTSTESPGSTSSTSSAETETIATTVADATGDVAADHDEASDYEWDTSAEVTVSLDGDTASSDSAAVVVDGSTVTITASGTYRLSGELTDGQVVVDSADDGVVRLVFDGVDIASSTSAPVVITDAGKAMIVLAEGSTNSVSDADTYVYPDSATDEPDGAIFSTADLTITGTGALSVDASAGDGIVSKDGLVISGGDLTVTATDDAVRGKDYVVVKDSELSSPTITATAGGDGLKSTNVDDTTLGYVSVSGGTLDLTTDGDGIQAETHAIVSGGTLSIVAAGGSTGIFLADVSSKGIKGTASVRLSGGTVDVDSADDALHSDGQVTVSGGALTLASGDDGVHADGALTVSAGTVVVRASYEGLEAANITLSGGDLDVTATDDGINVSGGADSSGTGGPAGMGGGGGMGGEETFTADAETFLLVSGGTLTVDAGGDGLDSNGSISITGGTTTVDGPTDGGNGAIDANSGVEVSGGVLVAAGSAGMAVSPAASSPQASTMVVFDAAQPAGTTVSLVAADGTVVASYTPAKSFQTVVFSTPDLVAGATYTITSGGTVSGDAVDGLVLGGTLSGSTDAGSVTV